MILIFHSMGISKKNILILLILLFAIIIVGLFLFVTRRNIKNDLEIVDTKVGQQVIEEEIIPEPEIVEKKVKFIAEDSVDSDGDGLKDVMEIEQFGTDPNNIDTDGDGYGDGSEIINGYNPLGAGKLED